MPLIERPPVGDEQPDPEEESTLSQAITIYNQGIETLQSGVEEVRQIAAALPDEIEASLAEAKASGMFDGEDGYTPVRGVDYWTDEDQQVISDQANNIAESVATTTATEKTDDVVHEILNSPSYKESIKGDPGKDGVSPIARINQSQYGATISIIDAYGTTTAAILHGAKGDPGPGVPAGGSTDMVLKKKTDSDYDTEWAEDTKGVSDVQVNGISVVTDNVANVDLSEYVQKTDYATNSEAGVVKVSTDYGLQMTDDGFIRTRSASQQMIRAGENNVNQIAPKFQHYATFYGLAKAAGDSTQSASDNAVGAYTDEAKAAIQQMLDVPSNNDIPDVSVYATKANTVLETTLSRGRKANTTVGEGSFAFGNSVEASGDYSRAEGAGNVASGAASYAEGIGTTASSMAAHAEGISALASGQDSHAEGNKTQASGNHSHAEGYQSIADSFASHAEGGFTKVNSSYAHAEGFRTVANGNSSHAEGDNTVTSGFASHVEGQCNVEDSYVLWPEWIADTNYSAGDKVKLTSIVDNETVVAGYICKIANSDAEFTASNWTKDVHMNYLHIAGNGTTENTRSNAYALTWTGDGHYAGDVYVHSNTDSTGGTKLATIEDIPVQDVQVNNVSVVTNGVANVPIASSNTPGVVKIQSGYGLTMFDGIACINTASSATIKSGAYSLTPITPNRQHEATFYGLAKAAGEDMSASSNAVGTYTDAAKTAIKNMIGVEEGLKVVRLI